MSTIFERINSVQKALSITGMEKGQKNTFDNYNFRGIDDVYNVMGPILAEHGVMISPTMVKDETNLVQTSKGKATFHTKLVMNYTVYSVDGTSIISTVPGEAMDRGDKGQNKAMSAAYKNLVFQLFCIPVQGQDTETETHEIVEPEKVMVMGDEERKVILDMCMKTGTELDTFVQWLGFTQLTDVPLTEYARAVNALQQKLDKMSRDYQAEQDATAQSQQAEAF